MTAVLHLVTLSSAPVLTEHTEREVVARLRSRYLGTPPVGTLTVASLVRRAGLAVRVVDSSRVYLEHIESGGAPEGFARAWAQQLADHPSDLYGFSTMCDSYPLTLLCARALRQMQPDVPIVLGGPQATGAARETLAACPWIDFVLGGETEQSLAAFVQHAQKAPERVPGLTWRASNGAILQAPPAPPAPMHQIPEPLWEAWPGTQVNRIPMEVGRGCPYACRFCSTSGFFGRRYRVKPVPQVLAEATRLRARFASPAFVLLHDNLLVDESWCHALARGWAATPALRDAGWHVSARLESLSPANIQVLKEGGCRGLFVGVESGSPRMQRVIGKKTPVARLTETLERLHEAGLGATLSYILGFPEETAAERTATVESFVEVLSFPRCRPQVTTLAVLSGTSYAESLGDSLALDGWTGSLLGQPARLAPHVASLVAAMPTLFPAQHSISYPAGEAAVIRETALLLRFAGARFRWLLVAAAAGLGGAGNVVRRWLARPEGGAPRLPLTAYASARFGPEFLAFLEDAGHWDGFDSAQRAPFLELVGIHRRALEHTPAANVPAPPAPASLDDATRLHAPRVLPTAYSHRSLLTALRTHRSLAGVPPVSSLVAVGGGPGGARIEEPAPLARAVLSRFLSPTPLAVGLAEAAAGAHPHLPPGVPVGAALRVVVQSLLERGDLARVAPGSPA